MIRKFSFSKRSNFRCSSRNWSKEEIKVALSTRSLYLTTSACSTACKVKISHNLKLFSVIQDLLEAATSTITVVVVSTFACQTNQSTTSTRKVFSPPPLCMVLNMRLTLLVHSRAASTITTCHVQCVTSRHVPLRLWYPQGMTVLLIGPSSIMGIWCHGTTTTRNLVISCALMQTRSSFTEATREKMAPCCTLWKGHAVRCHVCRMFPAESWHALCAPSEEKQNDSRKVWLHVNVAETSPLHPSPF